MLNYLQDRFQERSVVQMTYHHILFTLSHSLNFSVLVCMTCNFLLVLFVSMI
uniref:Uncharacterized protein n=1 Tax=Arundo donax TaxID=35708 RepID=A0A0A8ZZC1_ARUDO